MDYIKQHNVANSYGTVRTFLFSEISRIFNQFSCERLYKSRLLQFAIVNFYYMLIDCNCKILVIHKNTHWPRRT